MQQGVVSKIFENKFGNKTFYSFGLKGVQGSFGTGVKRPPREGTYVRFHDATNSRGYKEVDGPIEIVPEGEVAPASSASQVASESSNAGGLTKDQYWSNKEARDVANDRLRELGASRNTAISFIDLALRNEVIKLPAAAKREEFLWTLLDKYTSRLMGKEETKKEEVKETKEIESAGPDVGDGDNWN